MIDAPLAPDCRHCGATNDSDAWECWLCHRRDWRGAPKTPSRNPRSWPPFEARASLTGCLVLIITILCAVVGLAFRASPYLGALVLLPTLVILALAVALFTICMAFG